MAFAATRPMTLGIPGLVLRFEGHDALR